jgi:hypothetical protein
LPIPFRHFFHGTIFVNAVSEAGSGPAWTIPSSLAKGWNLRMRSCVFESS